MNEKNMFSKSINFLLFFFVYIKRKLIGYLSLIPYNNLYSCVCI